MSESAVAETFDSVQDWVESRREAREQSSDANEAEAGAEEATEEPEEEIEAEVDETEVNEEISEDDPSEEEVNEASDEDSGVDDEQDEEAVETPETPAVEAPQHLLGDDREMFSKLQPEAQQMVAKLAKSGEALVTKKTQELSQTRQLFQQRMEGLDDFISETEQAIKYYDSRDWQASYNQCETAEQVAYVNAEKAKADDLKAQIQEAKKKRGEGQIAEHRVFIQERTSQLAERAKDSPIAKALTDSKDGAQRQKDVFAYMHKNGLDRETLLWVPATGIEMAYKAMMYDKGNEKARELPTKQRTQAKPAPKTVKSTSSGVQGSSTSKRLKTLQGKAELSPGEFKEMQRLKRSRRK